MATADEPEASGEPPETEITAKQTLALFEARTLLDEIEARLSTSPEPPLLLRLVELHNEGQLDLLSVVDWPEFENLAGFRFFTVQHFLDAAIPELDAPTEVMMRAVARMVAKGGNDGAANLPNAAFLEWCNRRLDQARDVVALALAGEPLAIDHLTFALQALADRPQTREIALTSSGRLRFAALTALSRMKHDTAADRDATLTCLATLLAGTEDDELRAMVLDTAVAVYALVKAEMDSRALEVVADALREGGDTTLHRAAMALWTDMPTMSTELADLLLAALQRVNPKNHGTIDLVDQGLASLVGEGGGAAAVGFVTKLLPQLGGQIPLSMLDSFGRALLEGDDALFKDTIVAWLLSGSPVLCRGLDELIGRQDRARALDIDFAARSLSNAQVVFLCRKAVGYFFMHPIVAGSILVSVLRTAPNPLAAEVEDLLFDPLLVNYGGDLHDHLKSLAEDDPAQARVASALAQAENYIEGLRSVGAIKELHPSEHQRQAERARMADQMAAAMKAARKQSVFLSMIKQSAILYGNRTVSFIEDPSGERRRIEMEMKPHSFMQEWPRTETIDPVGLDQMLMVLRVETFDP